MKPLFHFLKDSSFSALGPAPVSRWLVERSIVLSPQAKLSDTHPLDFPKPLTPFHEFALRCVIFFLANRWKDFSDDFDLALKHIEDKQKEVTEGFELTFSTLLLFAWIASRRTGKALQELELHGQLTRTARYQQGEVKKAVFVENSRELMGKGCYFESLEGFHAYSDLASHGAYWEIQSLVIESTCLQALGRFDECETALKKLAAFRFYGATFEATLRRKQLSLLVEKENYRGALQLAKKNTRLLSNSLPSRILFQLESLRCEIAFGKFGSSQKIYDQINLLRLQGGLSHQFATFLEEEAELALMSNRSIDVLPRIQESLWQAQLKGDFAAQCVLLQIMGRALASAGKHFEARRAIESSVLLATSENYGRAGARGHMFLGLALLKEGRDAEAHAALLQAEKRARKIGLQTTTPLAEALLCSGQPSLKGFRALSALHQQVESLQPFLLSLNQFHLAMDFPVQIVHHGIGKKKALKELKAFEAFKAQKAVEDTEVSFALPKTLWAALEMALSLQVSTYFIQERILLSHELKEAKFQQLTVHSNLIFQHLLAATKKGASMQELFEELEPNLKYRHERHRARMSKEISALRASLQPLNISIIYKPETLVYLLSFQAPLWSLKTSSRPLQKKNSLTPLEQRILQELELAGELSTTQLRAKLGHVSRQALHRPLKNLEAMNLIRMKPQGRSSSYLCVGARP